MKVVVEIEDALKAINLPTNVPMIINFDHSTPMNLIGEANCSLENETIVADLYFYGHDRLKENLRKEGLLEILRDGYPAIGGKILEKDEDGKILKFKLTSVGICDNKNKDKRIKLISEQIKMAG